MLTSATGTLDASVIGWLPFDGTFAVA
jgi:hypothetical protein